MITVKDGYIKGEYTLNEFLLALEGEPANKANADDVRYWRKRSSSDWMGTDRDAKAGETAFQVCQRLITDGWQRGMQLMDDVRPSVELDAPPAKSIKRRMRRTDQGDEIDMQSVWNADLDRAWWRTTRVKVNSVPRVRIVVDSLASAGETADSMRWRGVAAMVMCDLMVAAGYSVQVESGFTGRGELGKYNLRVIVKDYTQPLDLQSLAATTVMPAFFRSMGHLWQPIAAPKKTYTHSGYSVRDMPKSDVVDEGDAAPIVMFGQSIRSAKDAINAIKAATREVQGDLLDDFVG